MTMPRKYYEESSSELHNVLSAMLKWSTMLGLFSVEQQDHLQEWRLGQRRAVLEEEQATLEHQRTPYHIGWQSLHAMQRLSKNFVGQRREARERQEPSLGSPLSYASESSTGQRIEGGQRAPEPCLWEPYYGTGEVPQETTEGELSVQEWTKGGPLLLATRTLIGNWTRIGHGIELESRIWRGQKSPDLRVYVGLESCRNPFTNILRREECDEVGVT